MQDSVHQQYVAVRVYGHVGKRPAHTVIEVTADGHYPDVASSSLGNIGAQSIDVGRRLGHVLNLQASSAFPIAKSVVKLRYKICCYVCFFLVHIGF